jgi:hypothetical protein
VKCSETRCDSKRKEKKEILLNGQKTQAGIPVFGDQEWKRIFLRCPGDFVTRRNFGWPSF